MILEILIKNSCHSNFLAEFCSAVNIALEYINNLRYADNTTLIAENKEPLDEGRKGK